MKNFKPKSKIYFLNSQIKSITIITNRKISTRFLIKFCDLLSSSLFCHELFQRKDEIIIKPITTYARIFNILVNDFSTQLLLK